ncbi:Starch-binding associating with outer membrane [Dyadobacter soli]|uniref:Starch-binding associating with outer membrane n=1 Tax=Dyadobacter soli TaxID=659014 RepID=A0A1G7VI72_9BACT|nr:RagB/SusD family nutrient uptake outer membrane protein [Dyadobacter soli]SDG59532.1 Starch-binding associating with outer membrane [Dyadobacter soli]
MKFSLKISLVFGAVSFLTCCKDDFLDRTPLANISDAQYWKSANDLKLYTNGYYNDIRLLPSLADWFQTGIYGLDADLGSDNMIKSTYNSDLNGESVLPASNTNGKWDWTTLRGINYFMDNYRKVTDNATLVNPYVGETLFFRALFYFDKLKTFGDLPWINAPLTTTDSLILQAPRLSRSVIADSIIHDLDRAIALLPGKAAAEPSRINKEIAMLLQSRVALYEGSWEKYHQNTPFGVNGQDGTRFFQKAANAAEGLMKLNTYAIENTGAANGYQRLFNQVDYSNSSEVMFWRKFDLSAGITHHWYLFIPLALDRGVTKSLVDDYLCTDGKPASVSALYKGDNTLNDLKANRDPRLAQTVYFPGDAITTNRPNGQPDAIFQFPDLTSSANVPTGYVLRKGTNTEYFQQSGMGNSTSTQALIYFRYAEALLNFAEAKAELGTLTQGDLDQSINVLRKRVQMPDLRLSSIVTDPKWLFPDLSPLLNEIRRERRVELACEGFRHDDIFRWAAAGKLIRGWQPKGARLAQWGSLFSPETLGKYPVDANGYITPYQKVAALSNGFQFKVNRDYLSPIPTDQLVLNPNLKPNNPNWD